VAGVASFVRVDKYVFLGNASFKKFFFAHFIHSENISRYLESETNSRVQDHNGAILYDGNLFHLDSRYTLSKKLTLPKSANSGTSNSVKSK